MSATVNKKDHRVISYMRLRKTVGYLGIGLPIVLGLGAWIIFGTGLQDSLSRYYYTDIRSVFVGTLCVIGFFLFSYKGYPRKKGEPISDNMTGNLACLFALCTALFPAAPDCGATRCDTIIGYVHNASAGLFIATLAYYSLFLFTKTHKDKAPPSNKQKRNIIYIFCGCLIGLCLALIGVYFLLSEDTKNLLNTCKPVFWLESLAIWMFGISWFTKGQVILKDKD